MSKISRRGPMIDLEKIKNIDFDSIGIKKQFDKIELENVEIIKSTKISAAGVGLRFNI